MKKCFVISPIGADGSETRKRADKLYKYIISEVCAECGFEAIRVDQINQSDSITQTIIDYLKQSELVIADMTDHNPNAFYEMGYRAAMGKPMIHVKEKGQGIPFDISNIRAFDYDLTDLDAVAEVKERLKQTVNAFDFNQNVIDENTEATKGDDSKVDFSQILPVLYKIQDEIGSLRTEIHNKDTETIQAIVKAAQPTVPMEDPNTSIMKAMLPEMLKNPDSFKTLMEFSQMVNQKK